MSLRRNLADYACRALLALSPPALREWSWAIRCETLEISNDGEALLFALAGIAGLMPRVILFHLSRPFAALVGAVALSVAYMAMAHAPARLMATNLGALVIGLAMMALIGRAKVNDMRKPDWLLLAMATVLVVTTLSGCEVNGISRWVRLGGVALQPSLVLLPTMILLFARTPNLSTMAGMLVAAAALATMPDRAMAGMLAASLAALYAMRPERPVLFALAGSLAAFAATMTQADSLPATAFVDGVLFASREIHPLAGMAVLGGAVFMLVPALIGWHGDRRHAMHRAVFGVIWLTCLLAAACGNCPTPVVGYGGSAILGYALSLATLSQSVREHGVGQCGASDDHQADHHDKLLPFTPSMFS